MQHWASLFVPVVLPGRTKPGAVAMKRQKTVEEDRKKELTKILLQVYMDGGYAADFVSSQKVTANTKSMMPVGTPWPNGQHSSSMLKL